tara:strand:- start:171 stop:386 length:216 start_codon:yes stop_codon:yes gene_type:complete
MKRFLSIIILVSLSFSYEVGDQISVSDQQLTKEVCYGHSLTTGDDFSLYNLNGAYNGGEYHVLFLDLSASW